MSRSAAPKEVRATLAHDVGGAFGLTWPKGTAVTATPQNRARSLWTIRRDPPKGALTVTNVMTSVPAFALGLEQARKRGARP